MAAWNHPGKSIISPATCSVNLKSSTQHLKNCHQTKQQWPHASRWSEDSEPLALWAVHFIAFQNLFGPSLMKF